MVVMIAVVVTMAVIIAVMVVAIIRAVVVAMVVIIALVVISIAIVVMAFAFYQYMQTFVQSVDILVYAVLVYAWRCTRGKVGVWTSTIESDRTAPGLPRHPCQVVVQTPCR